MSEWNDIIDVRCGWTEPFSYEEMGFNFHLCMSNKLSWRVSADFQAILELRNNIHSYTEEITIEAQFPLFNVANVESMLHSKVLNLEGLKALSQIARQLETWMNAVLLSLPYLDRESQAMVKQIFFRDLSRIPLYETLYRKLQAHDIHRDTTATQATIQFKENSSNRSTNILYAVTKLFSRKGRDPAPGGLTSKNLSAVSTAGPRPGPGPGGAPLSTDPVSIDDISKKKKKPFGLSFGIRSVRSGTSAKTSQNGDFKSALDVAQNSVLLKVEVQRGHEIKQGVLCYQISLIASGKMVKAPIVVNVHQRYNNFKKLYLKLNELNEQISKTEPGTTPSPYSHFMLLVAAPFPVAPMKSFFGLSLNDSELSVRTRMLDAWFRDVAANYRNMPAKARLEVRTFLNLDMEKKKDQFFQDQLVWGTVETNNGTTTAAVIVGNDGLLEVSSMSYAYTATTDGGKGASAPSASDNNYTRSLQSAMVTESKSETRSVGGSKTVRFGGPEKSKSAAFSSSGNSSAANKQALAGMVWETASQGGASRIPKKHATKASRANVFQKRGQLLPEVNEDAEEE